MEKILTSNRMEKFGKDGRGSENGTFVFLAQ